MGSNKDWQAILERWNVNFIVIEPRWRIADLLPIYGWEELYRDEQLVILGRSINNRGQE
jgi:hypothetical protein